MLQRTHPCSATKPPDSPGFERRQTRSGDVRRGLPAQDVSTQNVTIEDAARAGGNLHMEETKRRPGPTDRRAKLVGENLLVVRKGLELERIARGIEKEHRPLLTDFAGEAHVRLDDKVDLLRTETRRKQLEIRDRENDAEMRHRDVVAVDLVVMEHLPADDEVGDQLVTEQVPIDPLRAPPAPSTTEKIAVEGGGCDEVVDGDREMKAGNVSGHHGTSCHRAIIADVVHHVARRSRCSAAPLILTR